MGAGDTEQQPDGWYLLRDDTRYGPYSFATLAEAATQGIIERTDLLWRPGWRSWREASVVPGLFASPLSPGSAPGPGAPVPEPGRSAAVNNDAKASSGEKAPAIRGNYLLRHWRGELSLPVSYWLNSIAATVIVYVLALLLVGVLESTIQSAGSGAIAGLLAVYLAAATIITVWLTVGVWRSASRHTARGGRAFWAGAAKVMVVLSALRTVIEFGNSFLPMISEHVQIAMGDKRFGENHFRLLRNGTELEFSGGINSGTAEEFERMLAAAPQVKVLHLNSIGGRLADADRMAEQVRKRGLTTYVADQCESACTHVFLAGRERWISERASLGFHQPHFPGLGARDLAPLIEQQRHYLRSNGLPDEFVGKVLATPSSSMWRPMHAELQKARVISGIVDGSRFAASGHFASAATPDRLVEGLLKIPVYAALKRVEPQAFDKAIQYLADGYGQGATEEDIVVAVRGVLVQSLQCHLPYASDVAVLESADVAIGYLMGLKDVDAESCVAIADGSRGARLKSDLGTLFPELSKKELELKTIILETGPARRYPIPAGQDVKPHLTKIFDRLRRRPDLQIDLLDKPKLAPADYKPYCEVELAMLQEVRRLPRKDAVDVLRFLYSQTAK